MGGRLWRGARCTGLRPCSYIHVLIIFFANQAAVVFDIRLLFAYTVPHADDEKQRGALLIAACLIAAIRLRRTDKAQPEAEGYHLRLSSACRTRVEGDAIARVVAYELRSSYREISMPETAPPSKRSKLAQSRSFGMIDGRLNAGLVCSSATLRKSRYVSC